MPGKGRAHIATDDNKAGSKTSQPLLARAARVWRAAVTIQGWLFGVLLVGIVLVSLVNVFMRYVLTSSITWADEVARLSFIVVSFLGAGLAVAYGSHLVIDTLVGKTSGRSILGNVWRGLIALVSIGFFVVLIIGGLDHALRSFGTASPALRIPLGYVYLAVPVGGAIMCLNLLGVLLFGPVSLPLADDGEQLPAPDERERAELI